MRLKLVRKTCVRRNVNILNSIIRLELLKDSINNSGVINRKEHFGRRLVIGHILVAYPPAKTTASILLAFYQPDINVPTEQNIHY